MLKGNGQPSLLSMCQKTSAGDMDAEIVVSTKSF